jgi:hypothetical protein
MSGTYRERGSLAVQAGSGWSSCSRAAPQVQERLTQQVADWLQEHVAPRGVGVVVEAEHLCMTMRGVGASGATTVTSALHGQLRSDAASRAEFFSLISATKTKRPTNKGSAQCLTRSKTDRHRGLNLAGRPKPPTAQHRRIAPAG